MLRHLLNKSVQTTAAQRAIAIYKVPPKSFEQLVISKFNSANADEFYAKHIASNHLDTKYQKFIMTTLFETQMQQQSVSADTMYWFKLHEHEIEYSTIYKSLKDALRRKDKKTAYLLLLFFPTVHISYKDSETLLNLSREIGDPFIIAQVYERYQRY